MYLIRAVLSVLLGIVIVGACQGQEESENINQYLGLVDRYKAAARPAFTSHEIRNERTNFEVVWGQVTIRFAGLEGFEPAVISLVDANEGQNAVRRWETKSPITNRYVDGAYAFRFSSSGAQALVVVSYPVGASGWSANAKILHLFVRTESNTTYQELSTFFSGLDAFADLDADGIYEFLCLNLVLEEQGSFIVPNVFQWTSAGYAENVNDHYVLNAGVVNRQAGLQALKMSDLPESAIASGVLDSPSALRR